MRADSAANKRCVIDLAVLLVARGHRLRATGEHVMAL